MNTTNEDGRLMDAEKDAAGVQEFCRFPDCKCPMDPGPSPDWCARSLPHSRGVPVSAVTGPHCRDCADFAQDGICPNSGKPCTTDGVDLPAEPSNKGGA
jgi:hypothetical protein